MTDTAINDVVSYPNTTPAAGDHMIGTDVSNTSNSADGETVTFEMQALATVFANLAGGWRFVEQLSGTTSPMTSSAFADGFEYRCVGFDIRPGSGSSRYIYFDIQKDSDSSWIVGTDTTNNEKGMLTDNTMVNTQWAQIDVTLVDPRISRVNHQINVGPSNIYAASLASLSDAFPTTAATGQLASTSRHVNFSSADKISAIRITSSSASFGSGGTINIYKRPISHS